MSFYTFSQNNSGGCFTGPATYLIVEANNAHTANERAESHGVYFDHGYERDCDCCGTRWNEVYGEGDEVPSIYGQDVSGGTCRSEWDRFSNEGDIPYALIHYADGTTKTVEHVKISRS
jgi:hypothetical protein